MANDKRDETANGNSMSLPKWDLRDLFPSPQSPEFLSALDQVEENSRKFSEKYKGKIKKLTGNQLGEAIELYEKISQHSAKVALYVELTKAVDADQNAWAQDISDRLRKAEAPRLFFELDINKLSETELLAKIAAPKLAPYGPWIGKVRGLRGHQLSEPAEKYDARMQTVATDAWVRLYDQLVTDLRFDLRGEKLTEAEIFNAMETGDSKLRREAFASITEVLAENKKSFALITNTLIDLKKMSDTWRKFDAPEDSRHVENQIDKETVEALTKTVRDNYSKTAHRYYAWKAKKSGVARLHPADRNAPLGRRKSREYSWEEAKEIVLASFAKLSPEMAALGQEFFDKGWIDAAPRAGKDSGGFSHPATPDTHPYILVNFFGGAGDVMTLAHELGHGIHQVLAGKQGHLKADTPLTLAETASVFGEMLCFKELLSRETDMAAQRAMIAQKVEDMLNTVVRQTAFFTFEQRVHKERAENGELSPERIGAIWKETQKESLGPAVNLDVPGAENLWMSVPHFIHTPFYVYAYAFGDCLVNALYDEYSKAADKKDFTDKYIELLKSGGTKRHDAALAEFGLDTTDPAFWKKGMSVIERYIDDLVALDAKIEQVQKKQADFKANGDSAVKPAANDDAQRPAPKKKPKGPAA